MLILWADRKLLHMVQFIILQQATQIYHDQKMKVLWLLVIHHV